MERKSTTTIGAAVSLSSSAMAGRWRFLMRQSQLVAHGEPSDVIELNTVSQPALGPEDVLVSMEAVPLRCHGQPAPCGKNPDRMSLVRIEVDRTARRQSSR